MKIKYPFLLSVILVLLSGSIFAATGDTTKVRIHNHTDMTWFGNYDATGVLPPATKTYSKITMHYKMQCATTGCSGWDYTTQMLLMKPTGTYDSTLILVPNFTVNGNTIDTFRYSSDTTWVTMFDTLNDLTDSVLATTLLVREFSDTTQPYTQTDSFNAWPANYWNYYYDTNGAKIDSHYVTSNAIKVVYRTTDYSAPFEILQPYELGRVITPYGSYYNSQWINDYVFDVTDYASILHDSVLIRAFYSGYSSGFAVTLDFEFIEGTPARTVKNIHPMYKGYWGYGNQGNSIENYLVPKTFNLNTDEKMMMLRFTPTGHSFGGPDNCAEFCEKIYDVVINNQTVFQKSVWRNDCGENPLYHQSGTWLYDRANWCPGAKGLRHDFDIPANFFTPGQPVTADINFEQYTNQGGNPGYEITGELFTYGEPNHQLDAAIDDIISPTKDDAHSRFNPACANPRVVIKNMGATPLQSAIIRYGVRGETNYNYYWNGYLNFNEVQEVQLPNIVLNSGTADSIFEVKIIAPNGIGGTDENPYNDIARSIASKPTVMDSVFVFALRTNADANESNWDLKDDAGTILYSNDGSAYAPNTVYRDTFHLEPGCYTFVLRDVAEDGLSFFANNSGTGFARFTRPNNQVIKTFQADFGSYISMNFMVGTPQLPEPNAVSEVSEPLMFEVYPNPTTGKLSVDLALPKAQDVTIEVTNMVGQVIETRKVNNYLSHIESFDLSKQPSGFYFVRIKAGNNSYVKKVVVQK
jgi:hypothetical protein